MDDPTTDERIRQHADLVYRTCLRITGNAQDAADVAQEVFVSWLRQHREIRGSVAGWLYGTARQRSLDWLRTNHRRERHERAAAEQPAAVVTEDDWRQHLDSALEELPPPVRMLVVEHHLLGLTQGQLATRHRCTQATISRRLTQALDLLRAALRSRGVTVSGAVLVAGFTSARVAACPPPLVAPVLAQAQVVGVGALVGPLTIGGFGLLGWSAIAASLLLVLALGGGLGLWWWSTKIAHELDDDWTAVATAHLPAIEPAIAAAVRVPTPGIRYPSIEALIARQSPLNVARQVRVEEFVAPSGKPPWEWMGEWSLIAASSMVTKLQAGEALKADEAVIAQRWRARLQPLLAELRQGDVALGAGAALATAYANNQLGSMEQRNAWLRSRVGIEHPISRVVLSLLIHAALQAPDPRNDLADVDAWVSACNHSIVTIYEAMVAYALGQLRDKCYQELAWRGRLPPDIQQRWLVEKCQAATALSDALLGETLLVLLPRVEDLRAGRVADLGVFNRPFLLAQARDLTWLAQHLDTIQAVLAGNNAEQFRLLATNLSTASYWRSVTHQTELAALFATQHRAIRLSVEILVRTRAGKPLPEQMETGAEQESTSWGLRYERLSATRFALMVDPDGNLPTCSLPDSILSMRSRVQEARSKQRRKPLVNQGVLFEMDVAPPTTQTPFEDSADEPVTVPPEEEPPRFPSVAQ